MFYLFILPGESRLSHRQANSGGGNEAAQKRLKPCCSAGCSGVLIGAEETNTSRGAAIDHNTIFFFLPHGLTFAFRIFFPRLFLVVQQKNKKKNKMQQLPSRKSHSATSPHFSN